MITEKPLAELSPAPATAAPDVSVVLVCMNNRGYLERCLVSWYGAGFDFRFDLLVVDNGSTDGTQAMLRERFPAVRLIENETNVGLSRACNQGIEATQGRYVLLLNDDTLVDHDSIQAMVDWLEAHPRAGAVGGKLLNPDGSLQFGYANFSTLREEFLIATGLGRLLREEYPSQAGREEPAIVDWLCSACLFLRREALGEVGLLDEEFFIYGDEVDLQYRLKQRGWPVYYLPSARTIHFGGRSLDRWRRRKMVYRGKLLFYRKNYGAARTCALKALLTVLSAAKLACWKIAGMLPERGARARQEIDSNLDVIKLCRTLK